MGMGQAMAGTLSPYSPDALARFSTLFAGPYPVPIRLWAMLDGVIVARLDVDCVEAATWALLQELAEGTVYIGGVPTPERLGPAIPTLRQTQDVVICTWLALGFPIESLPPPDYRGMAVDFTGWSPAVDLAPLTVVPPHYELRRLEPAMVPLLDGVDYYVAMFGNTAAALQGTIGYCVLYEGDIVAEAFD